MKYFILSISICFAFLSCKKDDSSSDKQTKTDLITSGSWKYESGGADIDKNGSIDVDLESTGQIPACLLDNSATFNANGTGINDEGATKCDNSLPQTTTFTWAFVNNETAINIAGSAFAGISGQFKVVTLTDTKFTISKDTTVSSFPATLIVNLKH
ncbi:MAG: hypothetical protein ACTHOF_06765 [Flavisolibacter sp.]